MQNRFSPDGAEGDNISSSGTPSLDEILDQIKRESVPYPKMESQGTGSARPVASAGTSQLTAHFGDSAVTLTPILPAAQSTATELTSGQPAVQEASVSQISQSSLTARQRSLPKLDFRMVGAVLAVLVMMIGVGSATLLTQEKQDLRQQAFEATPPPPTTLPQFATPVPSETESQEAPATAPQKRPMLGITYAIAGLAAIVLFIILAVFLAKLFVV